MLFFKQHWGPAKKRNVFVCWCCSLYGIHVVLAHVLCVPVNIMETQENPGNQQETAEKAETSRKPRKTLETKQKQQKQAENTGKPRKPSRKNTSIRLRVLSTNKAFFCVPSYPPPPPGALSRNGDALSLNNVFPATLFGKHGRKTLSLNSLLSAEKLEKNTFKSLRKCRTNKTQCAELQFGENSWKKDASRKYCTKNWIVMTLFWLFWLSQHASKGYIT